MGVTSIDSQQHRKVGKQVQMNGYREEQALLPASVPSPPVFQNASPAIAQPQQQPPPQQSQVQVAPPQVPVVQSPPRIQITEASLNKVHFLLDYLIIGYYAIELLVTGELSKFGMFWLAYYFIHLLMVRPHQIVHRNFILAVFLWHFFVLAYNKFKLDSLARDEKVYLVVYSLEIIPIFFRLLMGCCVICCTCACATCCVCYCLFAGLAQLYLNFMERNKYKKIREDLCHKNMREITDVECPICLETGSQMNTQNCHHSFHPVCLENWLKAHKTCPLCRVNLY